MAKIVGYQWPSPSHLHFYGCYYVSTIPVMLLVYARPPGPHYINYIHPSHITINNFIRHIFTINITIFTHNHIFHPYYHIITVISPYSSYIHHILHHWMFFPACSPAISQALQPPMVRGALHGPLCDQFP